MKILVIRFSAIGDIVWTTPAIRCLKQQIPNAVIHFCTKKIYQEVVENNPYIDTFHFLDEKGLHFLLKTLQNENFDFVIDLHNNQRTAYLKFRLGKKSYTYKKLRFRRWLFVKFKLKNVLPKNHIADRYLETLKPLGIVPDQKGLDFFIAPNKIIPLDYFPELHQKEGFAVFVIGASYFTKRLPIQKMLALCKKITLPIVLIGGKEDQIMGDELINLFEKETQTKDFIFNTCGKLSIAQSASVVQQSKVVFAHDTGMMHIAAAFQKKLYSIWGSTVPELGLFPYKNENAILLENKNISCRPCSRMGKDACPKKHFKCMNDLDFSNVVIE
ncbi:MAG: glycosyltransferase family 9 protein [Bacteroidetes bacterium]|nr:MAG: glycosyltransferase family 9 protein [Bacteroidota bacterium]TAG88725.1 MAG: glycosyltransferase family 9 protein [Bacteroidota bacterium]